MPDQPYIPFSQRVGLAPIPPQLKVGEISPDLRRFLHYAILKDLESDTRGSGYGEPYLDDRWAALARDIWVRVMRQSPDTFRNVPSSFEALIKRVVGTGLAEAFDFVEFILRHKNFGEGARREVAQAFVEARSAYRVYDSMIVEVGAAEQAAAFAGAIADAEARSATGARKHLIEAGALLRKGDWAGSVRESIHAVESIAVLLAPAENTLGAALKVLEKQGHLHGSLKAAFDKLYGYSSDEKGVRHALVFAGEAQVDEADALFMLGACAAFVSYLLSRVPAMKGT